MRESDFQSSIILSLNEKTKDFQIRESKGGG